MIFLLNLRPRLSMDTHIDIHYKNKPAQRTFWAAAFFRQRELNGIGKFVYYLKYAYLVNDINELQETLHWERIFSKFVGMKLDSKFRYLKIRKPVLLRL